MKLLVRVFFVVFAATMFAASFLPAASAQKKDKFSHATAAHKKKDCNACHTNPTTNWVTARGFPDVADFPGHAACFACHRRDFFAGNKPAICVGCHTNPGPRGSARFPFPVRSRPQEFATVFPHNVHQDIIAGVPKRPDVAVGHFVKASFAIADDDPPKFNNCAICHKASTEIPQLAPRIPASLQPLADPIADPFVPTAGFFKEMPTGHQTCFACHFQGVKPTGVDCAGCHKLTEPYFSSPVVKRYSLKFDHQQKEHSVRDCMTCHVRISQNNDLKTLVDADVPFLTCIACHNHADDFEKEMTKRSDSISAKQAAFQCIYCHMPSVGRFPIPPSHQNR